MQVTSDHRTLQTYARLAGFMYLFVIGIYLAGDFLAGSFHVRGDFARTAASIAAGESLYRLGLALQLVASLTTVLLGGAFYVLLRTIDGHLALFAFVWRVLEAAIGGVAVIFKFAALGVHLGGAAAVVREHQETLAAAITGGARASFPVSVIYFAFGSVLFFWLLFRSRFIPRWLAALGLAASAIAALMGFATLVLPEQAAALQLLYLPIFVAEILTGLLLMIRGADLSGMEPSPLTACKRPA